MDRTRILERELISMIPRGRQESEDGMEHGIITNTHSAFTLALLNTLHRLANPLTDSPHCPSIIHCIVHHV